MKIPILLKLLQSCGTKATANFPNTRSRKGDKGFTLLELVVIVLILGILSAIAAPNWLAFINRQRVRTVNDRVFQSLLLAQSEAKRTKRDVTVTFNYDPNPPNNPVADPPTVTFSPPLATGGSTQQLNAGGEIKPGQVQLAVNVGVTPATPAQKSLTFKFNGAFDPNDNPPTLPFFVTVSTVGGGTKQCVIVQTLTGGMRTDEGKFDTTTKQGCP